MNLAQIISLAILVVTIVGLGSQILRSAFSMSVDLTLKLDDKFNSDNLRKQRAKAAKSILKSNFKEAEDVFDFFETVGLLVRRKALDKEVAWHSFFHWIHGYWTSSSSYLVEERRKNPSVYKDFALLHQMMCEFEKKTNHLTDSEIILSLEDLKEFLDDESKSATA